MSDVLIDRRWCPSFDIVENNTRNNIIFTINANKVIEVNTVFFTSLLPSQRYFLIRWALHQHYIGNTNAAINKAKEDYLVSKDNKKKDLISLLTVKIPLDYWLAEHGDVQKLEYILNRLK